MNNTITQAKIQYYFEDAKGNKLSLFYSDDKRWSFKGNKIPFPILGGTWFYGLSPNEMLKSIKTTGYILKAEINLITGKVTLYNQITVIM